MNTVLHHLRKLVAVEESRNQQDDELLQRFIVKKDEAAFCTLLERHGPMVMGVCRRVLHNEQDAEDALQATFLVFVRKASSIRRSTSVRSWLYGVAYRIARKAQLQFARQRACEQRAAVEQARPLSATEPTWKELQSVLDEELAALPEKYRVPILLCCLEGKSRDEAARELGWKEGTVKIRLERGRELLRHRLTQRGLTLSAVLFGTLLAKDAVAAVLPVRLVAGMVEVCMKYSVGESLAGLVTSSTIALADGMLKTLAVAKLKVAATILLLVGMIGVGVGTFGYAAFGGHQKDGRQAVGELPPAALTSPSIPEKPKLVTLGPEPTQAVDNKAEEQKGPTVAGTIRSVNGDGQALTVRAKESDKKYALIPTVQVVIDGKEARVIDLKPQYRVLMTLTPDGKEVVRVAATGPIVSCHVQSVDDGLQALTVGLRGDSRPQQRSFQVVADAEIVIDGNPARLTDLVEGLDVALQFSVDEKTVMKITGRTK